MANALAPRPVRLSVEHLEGRELPSVAPFTDPFNTPGGALSANWAQWSGDGSQSFLIAPGAGESGTGALASNGISSTQARVWLTAAQPADAQASADLYLGSIHAVQLFVRGQGLDSAAPSYYAVSVTRGMQVQLQKVENGQTTTLASLTSGDYLSNSWVRVELIAQGDQLQAVVFRLDTLQYLGADGQWHAAPTAALTTTDGDLTQAGFSGLARPAQTADTVTFDNFTAGPAQPIPGPVLAQQPFAPPAANGLPAGWSQWSNSGAPLFQVDLSRSLDGTGGLTTNGSSTDAGRAWLNTPMPADVQVSSAVYLNSLEPAQVFARGSGLGTATPSYYAVSVTRGTQVQLLKVEAGQTTVLATLSSSGWVSNAWAQVTLQTAGDQLYAAVYRADTGQYLEPDGSWGYTPTWALSAADGDLTQGGFAGVARCACYAGAVTFDNFYVSATPAAAGDGSTGQTPGTGSGLPAGWAQWSSSPQAGFQVPTTSAGGATGGLVSTSDQTSSSRAWQTAASPADVQVGADVYLSSVAPVRVFARGSNLDGATPTFYAASITRGLEVQLQRVAGGQTTVLGTTDSIDYVSNQWVHVSLSAAGSALQVFVYRADTQQYLDSTGEWVGAVTPAVSVADSAVTGAGSVGIDRPASYADSVYLGNLNAVAAQPAPPPVTTGGGTGDPSGGGGTGGTPSSPGTPTGDPGTSTGDSGAPGSPPSVPRHYTHIRLAELAYAGTPMNDFTNQLLKNSIDLVIPNTSYIDQINSVTPDTPQFIYSNVSNLYLSLLTDWLNYADTHGLNREEAFYHVTQATAFTGDSASSVPVDWFWNVALGSDGAWTDETAAAHSGNGSFALGGPGQSLALGYTEKFREINLDLQAGAAAGWQGTWEYVSATDANGNPTAWKPLTLAADTTAGLARSGRVTFDPPSDWVTASVNGSAPLYYVRLATTRGGAAPVVNTTLGRDYVNAQGTTSGVIPAFDTAADANGDGYLSDAEYARRRPGYDARFAYESRLFYPAYGQMRFATNVSDPGFQAWAVDYNYRYLQSQPKAGGLFMDNSIAKLPVGQGGVQESLAGYAQGYAALLSQINRKIAPRWVLANTAGAGAAADPLIAAGTSFLEEFMLRPEQANWVQFGDVAAQLQKRLAESNGQGYAVLDSYPGGGDVSDPRTQIATLAYYYLLGDPKQTFLMVNGGYEPNSSWQRHWIPAATFDVGQPAAAAWSVFATGSDPSNAKLTYYVFGRQYDNALVLYKPRSYTRGTSGTTADNTATTHQLGGVYRPLNADGTLGAPTTSVTLRNGEGAILVKV